MNVGECTGDGTILKVCTPIGNDPSLYTPKCGQIQFDNRLKWTRTENCFDKLTEVRNFIRALTECTGDGAYICITSGENGFEGLTSGRTSRAAPSQLKIRCQNKLFGHVPLILNIRVFYINKFLFCGKIF